MKIEGISFDVEVVKRYPNKKAFVDKYMRSGHLPDRSDASRKKMFSEIYERIVGVEKGDDDSFSG